MVYTLCYPQLGCRGGLGLSRPRACRPTEARSETEAEAEDDDLGAVILISVQSGYARVKTQLTHWFRAMHLGPEKEGNARAAEGAASPSAAPGTDSRTDYSAKPPGPHAQDPGVHAHTPKHLQLGREDDEDQGRASASSPASRLLPPSSAPSESARGAPRDPRDAAAAASSVLSRCER